MYFIMQNSRSLKEAFDFSIICPWSQVGSFNSQRLGCQYCKQVRLKFTPTVLCLEDVP